VRAAGAEDVGPIIHRKITGDNSAEQSLAIVTSTLSVETDMHNVQRPTPRLFQTDYSEAVAKKIAWLGNRYLLARPINAGAARASAWPCSAEIAGARIDALRRKPGPG
jgi:hypothetical protein